ncbi:MAG: hypothetical protein JRN52_02010 [Nitrososphaerota archaeon]|nr:hypothetical protein [Nitrososphaerota archaeon]
MPKALCYSCSDGVEDFILIVGENYWVKYPSDKEGMFEVRKIDDVRGGYLEHNCFHSTIEISEELETLLAQPELDQYLSEPKEVIEIYEQITKNSRGF